MAPAPPTRREALIVVVLLVVLLFLTGSEPSVPSPLETGVPLTTNSSSRTPLEAHTPKIIETRLTWGSSPPPATTIVAHVPGLYILFAHVAFD